jgi:hypothetical protein
VTVGVAPGDGTLSLSSADPRFATLTGAGGGTPGSYDVTFDPSNYNVPVVISVAAILAPSFPCPHQVPIVHSVLPGSAPEYLGVPPATLEVQNNTPCPVYTGRAYGASYSLLGSPTTFLADTGEVSTTSASDTPKSVVSVSAGTGGTNVSASALNADVQTAAASPSVTVTTPAGSNATASATNVNITIPGVPAIHADVLSSSSRSTCSLAGGTAPPPVGSAQITNLTIGGTPIPVGTAPNTTIPLGLLGSITTNEQTPVTGGLQVNALDVKALGTDIVVASSRSDIHNCP